jgi:hypothetical protein
MLKDVYCDCGQYLTKHFHSIGQMLLVTGTDYSLRGVQCPSKDCPRTYTVEMNFDGNDRVTIVQCKRM